MSVSLITTSVMNSIVRPKLLRPSPLRLIIFDIETTGLNPYHDHVIEIAAKDNYGNSYQSLVKPPIDLPAKITEITGITNDDLKNAPLPHPVALKFCEFLQTTNDTEVVMIGHNSLGFDCLFVKSWLERMGLKECDGAIEFNSAHHVDTMRLSQYYYPGRFSYALTSLCKYAGISCDQAHRAMGDVLSTEALFNHILSDIRRRKGMSLSVLDICRPCIQ